VKNLSEVVLYLCNRYARIAVSRAGVEINDEAIRNTRVLESLAEWRNVVVFYSIRLLVAPLVETAVLLDRLLFLGEQGSSAL